MDDTANHREDALVQIRSIMAMRPDEVLEHGPRTNPDKEAMPRACEAERQQLEQIVAITWKLCVGFVAARRYAEALDVLRHGHALTKSTVALYGTKDDGTLMESDSLGQVLMSLMADLDFLVESS